MASRTALVHATAAVLILVGLALLVPPAATAQRYLGELGGNPYDPDSTSNPYGRYGSPYGPGIQNPYSGPGRDVRNRYGTGGPAIVSRDGEFLGNLNSNPYDPNSVANPYGRYGNPYNPNSINNPFGKYGSRYSPSSPNNPFATQPPLVIDPDQ